MRSDPSKEYIDYICSLYGDVYDDREEDSAPGGLNWMPGQKAAHKSLSEFREELKGMGIHLSNSKLTKILITGGCWSTERSREIGYLYEDYTDPVEDGGQGMDRKDAVKRIAAELGISKAMVSMSLPYFRPVYDLDDKSDNAQRCDRWRSRKVVSKSDAVLEAKDELASSLTRDDEYGAALGARLKEERERSRLSIEEVAEQTGIQASKLRKWEENADRATVYHLVNLLAWYYKVQKEIGTYIGERK